MLVLQYLTAALVKTYGKFYENWLNMYFPLPQSVVQIAIPAVKENEVSQPVEENKRIMRRV